VSTQTLSMLLNRTLIADRSCHRRKTRCVPGPEGVCQRCERSNLTCAYRATTKKKGPKGRKAALIFEGCKEQQEVHPGYSVEAYNAGTSHEPQHLEDSIPKDRTSGNVLHAGLGETICAASLNL
jgi:hypothetical protein